MDKIIVTGSIDGRTFGRLESSLEHLAKAIDGLTKSVDELTGRVETLEGRFIFGKGAVAAAVIIAGIAGWISRDAITALTRVMLP